MLKCETPLRLPRLLPTSTAIKNLKFTQEISTEPGTFGAAFLYPSCFDTMKFFYPTTSSGVVENHVDWTWTSFNTVQGEIFLAMPLSYDAAVASETIPRSIEIGYLSDGYYISSTGHLVSGKRAYLKGTFVFTGAENINMYNSDNATADVTMRLYEVTGTTLTPIGAPITVAVAGHSTATFNVGVQLGANTYTNLAISIEYTNQDVIGHLPSGSSVFPRQGFFEGVTYQGEGIWVTRKLVSGLSEALTSQVENAASISYTGQSILMTNDTAQLVKGGHIVCAQLPSESAQHFPQSPAALFDFVSKQVRKPFYSEGLEHGCFASWTPDKLEDLFFKETAREIALADQASDFYDRPVIAFAWKVPPGISAQQLTFTVVTRFEIISDDISMSYALGPRDPNQLLACFMYLAGQEMLISENQNHLESIKDWVVKIASNPQFQAVASSALKLAGTSLLALV